MLRRDACYISAVFTTLWVAGVAPECANEDLATVTFPPRRSLQLPLRLMQYLYSTGVPSENYPASTTELQPHYSTQSLFLLFRHRSKFSSTICFFTFSSYEKVLVLYKKSLPKFSLNLYILSLPDSEKRFFLLEGKKVHFFASCRTNKSIFYL